MIANDQCPMSPLQEDLEKSCAAAVEADAQLKALQAEQVPMWTSSMWLWDVMGTMNVGYNIVCWHTQELSTK